MKQSVTAERVEHEVRDFIAASDRPVTFTQVIDHVAKSFPVGSIRAVEVKLATYRVIERGQAKITAEWELSKEEGAGAEAVG